MRRTIVFWTAAVALCACAPGVGATIEGTLWNMDEASLVRAARAGQPADIYMRADTDWLYLGFVFPGDVTDGRLDHGPIDMLRVDLGLSGDPFVATRYSLRQSNDPARLDPVVMLDGYHTAWLTARDVNGDGLLDGADVSPYWGPNWDGQPWQGGILTSTLFAPHRQTQWAIPMSLLGGTAGETVFAHVFAYTDLDGMQLSPAWPDYNDWTFGGYGDKTSGLSVTITPAIEVPEPTSLVLFTILLGALATGRRARGLATA